MNDEDPDFAAELAQADVIEDESTRDQKTWFPESVNDFMGHEIVIEHRAEPLNESEFTQRMQKKPIQANTKGLPVAMLPRADGSAGKEKNWLMAPEHGPARLVRSISRIGSKRYVHAMTSATHRFKSQGERTHDHLTSKNADVYNAIKNASISSSSLYESFHGAVSAAREEPRLQPTPEKAQAVESEDKGSSISFGQQPRITAAMVNRRPSFNASSSASQKTVAKGVCFLALTFLYPSPPAIICVRPSPLALVIYFLPYTCYDKSYGYQQTYDIVSCRVVVC
jgi:hypothetical protein